MLDVNSISQGLTLDTHTHSQKQAQHVIDPMPIKQTVRNTFGEFWRTHQVFLSCFALALHITHLSRTHPVSVSCLSCHKLTPASLLSQAHSCLSLPLSSDACFWFDIVRFAGYLADAQRQIQGGGARSAYHPPRLSLVLFMIFAIFFPIKTLINRISIVLNASHSHLSLSFLGIYLISLKHACAPALKVRLLENAYFKCWL